MRVLITDSLSPVALKMLENEGFAADVQLKKTNEELADLAAGADGWIIRSGTTITASLIEASNQLKVIGRAGVGVDNIDLDAATRKGVLVVNAPDGNTISTAEHTCAMIMALARQIPGAASSLAGGAWERKQFSGAELDGKTLGVVGVGKIGRAVAQRMQAFGMRTIGFDPVLSREAADHIGIELVPIEQIWSDSDFISFHTPLNDATRGLLSEKTIALCRPGVRVINIARGGIVDESALLPALELGQVGGVALDVYSTEPPPAELQALLAHPHVVATPHIAASTIEAQDKVAVQIVEQVVRALRGEAVSTPVNARSIRKASDPQVAPYIDLAERLGRVAAQVGSTQLKRLTVTVAGSEISDHADVLVPAVLVGLLSRWSETPVNLINASGLAASMGLEVKEVRSGSHSEFSNLLELELGSNAESRSIRGAIHGNQLRLVGYDDFPLEVGLDGHLLFYQNEDRPGMLAIVSEILAKADVNIAGLTLGRRTPGGSALTVLTTDDVIPQEALVALQQVAGVTDVRTAST